MDDQNSTPATPETPETPKENVTVTKPAPPENGGPGFITVGNGSGRSLKVKVDNIRLTVEELVKLPTVAEFVTQFLKKDVKLKIVKRDSA